MKRGTNTFKVAIGGIFLALTMIFLFGASVVPGIEMTLFACASFFTGFMLLETSVGGAVLFYVAATLLGALIIPNKVAMIPFAFLFGYYGIIKYFIEKIPRALWQIVVKAAYFAASITIAVVGFVDLFTDALGSSGSGMSSYPLWVIVIGGTLIMLLYDCIFTWFINLYERRVKNRGIDNFKLS